ncbi:nucleotidyltransferase family protein [Haloechinothrix halophila]|uniref:nucleotidyltransferase family protein n=1 Tax=Haloechinothrix halophila TaxID=1069073 RepID=UPI0004153493|nr:nucleotidyltransferase family protein [Haloechinothrix halophila]
MTVAGVLLAAGEGSRLGRPKALVELGGTSLVARGVEMLAQAGCAPVHVVTGAADVELPGVTLVANPDWRTGMASSLLAGLASLPADVDAVVLALVDQPLIGPDAVRRLIAAYRDGALAVVATYDGRQRNPVLLRRDLWAAAADAAHDDVGARAYLRAHPDVVTEVECGDIADPADIDTAADLAALERRLSAR